MDLDYHTANLDLEKLPIEIAQIDAASRIVYFTEPRNAGADRFRVLRMRLRELQAARKIKSLLITSPSPHDGKSTVVLNLATALAERGKRAVLVVEGDLHRPSLTQQLGLNGGLGLAGCLTAKLDPFAAIRRIEPLSWYLLSAGGPLDNASEVLQTENLPTVMEKLALAFDWILIDSPPVTPLTDTLSLVKTADATLLVTRAGRTPRRAVEDSIELLGRQHVCGIVLNGMEGLGRYYAGYGYY